MNLLTKNQILRLNYITIQRNGGNFIPPANLLNSHSIDYLVEIVGSEIFGQPAYPSIADKAGLYMHSIISNHAFSDGNKRTGLAAALLFLSKNGHKLKKQLTSEIIAEDLERKKHLEAFTILVAAAQVDLEQVQEWFKHNIEPT